MVTRSPYDVFTAPRPRAVSVPTTPKAMSFQFDNPYDRPSEPQSVRNDFYELASLSDTEELLHALVGQLSADVLASFIDDRLMGRV